MKQNKTVTITLRRLYNAFANVAWDVVNDCDSDEFMVGPMMEVLDALIRQDLQGIRQAFIDGYTTMLVPNWDEDITEVRIFSDLSLVPAMVVCGEELNY